MIQKFAVFALLTILSGFSQTASAGFGNDSAPQGGNFIYNIDAEPTTLNPLTSTDLYARYVQEWVVESLLQRNQKTYGWEPSLATKHEISKDGKSFTFTLRDGVQWSDGKPLTAEDVKFSFDVLFDPNFQTAHWRPYFEAIEKVEIVDPKTVRFIAKSKYFQNFDVCAGMAVLPKHIYSDSKNKRLNRELFGTGPYKSSTYEKGKKIVLEKNPTWWGYKEPRGEIEKGSFNFDKITFKFVKEDNIQIEMLKKGEIDFHRATAEAFAKKMVGPEWGKKVHKVKAENLYPKGYSFIGWNLKNELFKDRKVRIALAHLFNRDLIIEKFLSGLQLKALGPWYLQNEYASKNVAPIPFDTKQAIKLFKEAGWEDTDKNGLVDKVINGQKTDFKFTLLVPNPDVMKWFTVYKEDAKKAGVEIELKQTEWNTFIKLLDERKFDALTLSWSGVVDPDPKQVWHSTSEANQGSNMISYNNPEVDKMIDEARETLDKKQRIVLLQKVYEKIADDAPYLFLFNPKFAFYGHTEKIKKANDTLTYDLGYQYWWAAPK